MPGVKGRSGGQNRRSVEDLKLEGTFRSDRHGSASIKNAAAPDCEPWLTGQKMTKDQIAKFVTDYLLKLGVTEDVDGPTVSQLVFNYMLLQDAMEIYEEDPSAKMGSKMAYIIIHEAQKELRILYNQLRVLPGQRTPQEAPEMSKLETLMSFKKH